MNEEPERERVVTVDQLPDDPLKMPPPYWRSGGAVFHLEGALSNMERFLRELVTVHARTNARLSAYYEKYPGNDQTEKAMAEFGEVMHDLWELEHQIKLSAEIACLMSAIEAEDDINQFCVFNLHKDSAEPIEKLSPPDKVLIAAAAVGARGTKQASVFDGLRQLVSWRNAFAHGHCVDRPTKSLRHNHLIDPEDYPGVPSVLTETRELVGAFLRLSDYLRKISRNPYTQASVANFENIRRSLQKMSCYRFDGNNWAYDVMLTGSEQVKIAKALRSIVDDADHDKIAKVESVLVTLDNVRARIVRLEIGLEDGRRRDRKEVMDAVKLSPRRFERERAIALTRIAGAVDLIGGAV